MLFAFLRRAIGALRQCTVVDRTRQVLGGAKRRLSRAILLIEALEDRTLPSVTTILEAFDFAGTSGAEVSQSPNMVATNVTGGAISRSAGLTATNQNDVWGFGNAISSVPTNYVYGTSLASAAALSEYYQFTVAAQSGYGLSLTALSFNAYAQNGESTFGGALQYSVNGGNTFSTATLSGSLSGAGQRSPLQVTANLSGISALQDAAATVVFRIYLFGVGGYEDSGIGETLSDNDLQVTGTVNQNGQILPVVTSNTATLAVTATSLTIAGSDFDPTASHDSVSFSNGVTGTVSSATSTSLTVGLTGLASLTAGTSLTASATVDGTSSGSAVPVATVAPVVTSNTANLAATTTSLTIAGLGFDPTASHDSVSFSNGVTGTVISATTSSLTVGLTGLGTVTAGTSLTAGATVDGISSGSAVPVATLAPVVTSNTANLAATATSLTIAGLGFDPTASHDSVAFNNGVTGMVISATGTRMTVGLSGLGSLTAGTSLTASATVDGITSGSAVPVATLAPVVTSNTANLAATATSLTIAGLGFDPTASHDSVTFNSGVAGTVISATSTSLTVGLTGLSRLSAGTSLIASATVDGISSGSAVPVATVAPVVTPGGVILAATATSLTIAGSDFDPITSHDSVSFSNGVTGTVSSATGISLTVGLTGLGSVTAGTTLTASATVDGISSGSAMPVATIAPAVTPSSVILAATATSLTIAGVGFDPTASRDSVTFNSGVTGTVISATTTTLIVGLTGLGSVTAGATLTASATVDGISSGSTVPVATVAPVVTPGSVVLAATATSLTIAGLGFDPTASRDSVTFNSGVTGTVISATTTTLIVGLTGLGSVTAGATLTASTMVDGISSGSAVPVATLTAVVTPVAPVVTPGSVILAATATSLTIAGLGFDPTASHDSVTFNSGVTGTVISATTTSLTVGLTGLGSVTAGTTLTASATVDGISSGSAVPVATVGQITSVAPVSGVVADNAGGGWTGGGIVGQYYDNTTFSGAPSFTRTDDRIDFASTSQAPGGSTSPGFAAVAATNFSVVWTGSLIPAYSQTYTFDGFAADTFNLQISPAGQNNWTTVVNQTAYTGQDFSGTYTFTAGQTYNVKIQFVQYTGPWAAQLRWSSPSTPDEVINPLSSSGINAVTYDNTTYADAMKMGADQWTSPGTYTPVATDASGWPMADATNIVWQGANGPDMAGTYLLQFTGLANVSISFNYATFTVNGQTYNSLASGVGYNAATNTTTALVTISDQAQILYLTFTNSQRTQASALDTGVTDVHLMRPTSPGATTYYPVGTLFDANLEAAYSNFTTERWLTANFDTTQVNWSQRMLPGNAEADYSDLGEVWEYEVELANETGKDLYITIPMNANTQYVTNLANLIKYGSDGVNPYTSYQANPVYPGLNGNLHVYIEWSNETWNYSFAQAGAGITDSQQAVEDYVNGNTSAADYQDGAIIDFDGQAQIPAQTYDGDFRRWTALMTVQASNIFRSVFGNTDMGDQVRMVLEYQYDNDQDTALDELEFINDYFDNGDGLQHVANPEPVSYYIWGSGAAVYYSSPDATGTQTAITVPDASFETPVIAANTDVVDPSGTSWTFTGNAGIYNASGYTAGGTIGSLGYVNTAPDGNQAAFIGDTGSMSTTIDFTQTGTFAIQLYGAASSTSADPIRLYLGNQEITPDYQNDPNYTNPFDEPWVPGQYMFAINDTVFNSLGTVSITILTPGNYTLTIAGTGAVGAYTFLDDLQVTSLAAIFDAGVPGDGQANGQPQAATAGYQTQLDEQAVYAETFGLHVVAYEGGWSLGGDAGGTPLQNYAKYASSQATQANITSWNDFIQSGGALYIFGTYEQWPSGNTATASSFPLLQAVETTNNVLPPAPTNGLAVPAILTPANFTLVSYNSDSTLSTEGWMSWNIIVPATGNYLISAATGSGGDALLTVDDATTIASGSSGGTLSGTVTLTAGLHTIMIEATSGSFTIAQVTIAAPSALPAPVLNAALAGNTEVTVDWSAVSGAIGYLVQYGTAQGAFTSSITVGNVTTFTVPSLTNGQSYYFAVDAYNNAGDSLPSNSLVALPVSPILVAPLAVWSFSGYVGDETSASVTSNSSLLSVSSLTRGPGLVNDGNTILTANTFSSDANGYVFALNAAASIVANQYYQFTLTPAAGQTFSLQTLDFSPWFQNATGQSGDPRGAAITWSINGQTFSSPLIAAGTPSYLPTPFTVDLTGQAALQNTGSAVIIRIYLYGNGSYETCGLGGISVLGQVTQSAVATTTALTSVSTLTASTTTAVTFTATVTANSGSTAPNTGVVEFLNGTTLLGTATTSTTSGSAATFWVTSFLPAGTYSNIQAFYVPGSTAYASSNSSVYSSTLTVSVPPVFSGATSTSINDSPTQAQTFSGVAASGNATFSLINLPPAWVTINAITGVLTFGQSAALPAYSATKNTWTITIQAANLGGVVTESFTIMLLPPVS